MLMIVYNIFVDKKQVLHHCAHRGTHTKNSFIMIKSMTIAFDRWGVNGKDLILPL